MALKMTQSLKQAQSLMMTPQLQQAIKLLTMTRQEMTSMIADEMVENPTLEEITPSTPTENSDLSDDGANFNESSEFKKGDDFDWQQYVESYNNTSSTPSVVIKKSADEIPDYENIISKGLTLPEHLTWQLRMQDLTDDKWIFAESIINNINDDGYLSLPFEELLSQTKLSRVEASSVLSTVQQLDPIGCATENLADCLLVQATFDRVRSRLVESIIKNHLEDIRNNNINKIEKELKASVDAINSAISIIKEFHPRPGRLVSSDYTEYIIPDIYIFEVAGKFVVKVNEDDIPRLKISSIYREMLTKGSEANGEAREYVKNKIQSAMWLIKSIQTRQKTIEKVASAIVEKQQDFFKKGSAFLKPMVLRHIASEIGMHESTISRVTTNKYMHTPIGIFELKYFFGTGLGGKDGSVDISGEVLKLKIKALIDNEDSKRPLSDQKIVNLLDSEGIKIARRTVSKYRELLDILSSSKRKKRG